MPAPAQGFKLRVFMTGLCVFSLPKRHGAPVQVLLANAGDDDRIRQVTGKNLIRPHKPVIQFEVANRVSDVPSYPLFQDPEGKLNGLWMLDHEDVNVILDMPGGPDVRNYGPDPAEQKYVRGELPPDEPLPQRFEPPVVTREMLLKNPQMPGPSDDEDFFWVSPARAKAEPGQIGDVLATKAQFLKPELSMEDVGDDLAARFTIQGGKIEPAGFSFDSATREMFIYNIGGIEQAVASVVEWSIDVPGDYVTFKASGFSNHDHPRDHRFLTLRPAPGESDVEVWLLNREIDEVIGQNPPVESEFEGPLRQKHEYLFLSQLLEEPQQSASPVRGRRPRLARQDEHFKQAKIRNRTMRRIYFPGEDGEGDHVGGPCSPLSSTGG